MKNFFTIIFVLIVMMCILVGCNNDISKSPSISESPQNTESKSTAEPSSNEEIQPTDEPIPDVDGNPYTTHVTFDGETEVWFDYSEVYEKLDLSQYSSFGSFGIDGIMWVEKSDYKGKQFGYIDYNGNVVIPFTDEYVAVNDFYNGLAIVYYSLDGMNNGLCAIINTKGDVLAIYERHAVTKQEYLNNGNIFYTDIDLTENYYSSSDAYMFCKNTGKFVEMPIPYKNSITNINYSNGLLLIHSDYYTDSGTRYYDEDGNCVLHLETSNEYYKNIKYAENFKNGEAKVTFVGMDGNTYVVTIDKTGKWINEPEQISKSDANSF